jgi:DNA-binding NtrC family response regulator
MLERRGFEVLEAEGGGAAVELFRECGREIGAVVLDLTMPGMDGEVTFQRLRAIRDDVPVILMSGHSEGDVAARLAGKTRADFLEKPFTLTELTEKVLAQL